MVFSPMEYWYRRVVFLLLKQIVPLLRWITLPVVHMQIGRFLCKTYRIYFSKASVMLFVTGFIAIVSTGLCCFFFYAALLFLPQLYFCIFSQWTWQLYLLIFIFNGAAVFLVFHVCYVYLCLWVFYLFFVLYGFDVFQCLYVLMF